MARAEAGRIDCPVCKTKDGMRVRADRNGEPFLFCDLECGAQIRVGGNRNRLERFAAAHPAIAAALAGRPPVSPEPTEKSKAQPAPPAGAKPKPRREPEPEPAKPRSLIAATLETLGK